MFKTPAELQAQLARRQRIVEDWDLKIAQRQGIDSRHRRRLEIRGASPREVSEWEAEAASRLVLLNLGRQSAAARLAETRKVLGLDSALTEAPTPAKVPCHSWPSRRKETLENFISKKERYLTYLEDQRTLTESSLAQAKEELEALND